MVQYPLGKSYESECQPFAAFGYADVGDAHLTALRCLSSILARLRIEQSSLLYCGHFDLLLSEQSQLDEC